MRPLASSLSRVVTLKHNDQTHRVGEQRDPLRYPPAALLDYRARRGVRGPVPTLHRAFDAATGPESALSLTNTISLFYGSSCPDNGKGALDTPSSPFPFSRRLVQFPRERFVTVTRGGGVWAAGGDGGAAAAGRGGVVHELAGGLPGAAGAGRVPGGTVAQSAPAWRVEPGARRAGAGEGSPLGLDTETP
eukprot:1196401-Prorocentrum_minimum.AAC.4